MPEPPSWRWYSHGPAQHPCFWGLPSALSCGSGGLPSQRPAPCSMGTYEQSPSLGSYIRHEAGAAGVGCEGQPASHVSPAPRRACLQPENKVHVRAEVVLSNADDPAPKDSEAVSPVWPEPALLAARELGSSSPTPLQLPWVAAWSEQQLPLVFLSPTLSTQPQARALIQTCPEWAFLPRPAGLLSIWKFSQGVGSGGEEVWRRCGFSSRSLRLEPPWPVCPFLIVKACPQGNSNLALKTWLGLLSPLRAPLTEGLCFFMAGVISSL